MTLQSGAFDDGKAIPRRYTEDGEDLSPPLTWSGLPEGTRELALTVDDPDAPRAEPWVHWVIYKIPADVRTLIEGIPQDPTLDVPPGARQGKNSRGTDGYRGPAPPRGHGTHHYHFRLYALDAPLAAAQGLDKAGLLRAMQGHVLAEAELVGAYGGEGAGGREDIRPGSPSRARTEAGRYLAKKLAEYAGRPDVLVLALTRGGVPVAYEVALALGAPLDVFLVRKLGVPGHEELALGAIATGGVRLLNPDVVRGLRIPPEGGDQGAAAERAELERGEREYRGDRPTPDVRGKTVILIDDGLATGASMRAAVAALRQQNPARIVVAVPIAAPSTCEEFQDEVDEVVCARTPEPFYAVGLWYEDFSQTTDDEVRDLLARASSETLGATPAN